MVTSRMLLVVVGDVTRERVQQLVARRSARCRAAPTAGRRRRRPRPGRRPLAAERRDLPTNYVLGYFPGAAAWSPDYFPLRIAAAVLSGRFFAEIRSKRNLSYAVNAPFLDRATAAAGLYVTTTDPRTTLRLMREELYNLQEGGSRRAGWSSSRSSSSPSTSSTTRPTPTRPTSSPAPSSTAATGGARRRSSTSCGRSRRPTCGAWRGSTCAGCASPTWAIPRRLDEGVLRMF
jgi:hypothetical protein